MKTKTTNQIETLSLHDRQLLESVGEEAIHNAKKAKLILNNRNLKNQLKANNG